MMYTKQIYLFIALASVMHAHAGHTQVAAGTTDRLSTPLIDAIMGKKKDVFDALITENPNHATKANTFGVTPLHIVARLCASDSENPRLITYFAEQLLQNNGDPLKQDIFKHSPLTFLQENPACLGSQLLRDVRTLFLQKIYPTKYSIPK